LSALSNGACYKKQRFGYLVFGVEDKTHRLIGTDFNPNTTTTKGQELENWLACHLTPRIDFNIFFFEYQGLNFAVFRVQAALSRPVNFKQQAYIRIGSYKKKLGDHPEREKAIWSQGENYAFEKEICLFQVTPKSILEYIDYAALYTLLDLPSPKNEKSILEKLVQEKILHKNGNNFDITNMGAILFARDITNFEELARKAIRVIFYNGKSKVSTIHEQIGVKGYAVGFQGLITYLERYLPTNEIIQNALRKKVPEYPVLAIRELVANALIHQDFAIKGSSPMIEVYSNRIEITNPGSPLIDPDRFVDHSPQSRNEMMAGFMRRLKICEERGSGYDKVVFECEFNRLPAPEIVVGDNYTRIILYGLQSFKEMDKTAKIRGCYTHACIKYVSGEHMTNQSLRERFGVPEDEYTSISNVITQAIEANQIKLSDPNNTSRRYAKYIPYWA
jgi:ATP-dependent DNA helicase RecG